MAKSLMSSIRRRLGKKKIKLGRPRAGLWESRLRLEELETRLAPANFPFIYQVPASTPFNATLKEVSNSNGPLIELIDNSSQKVLQSEAVASLAGTITITGSTVPGSFTIDDSTPITDNVQYIGLARTSAASGDTFSIVGDGGPELAAFYLPSQNLGAGSFAVLPPAATFSYGPFQNGAVTFSFGGVISATATEFDNGLGYVPLTGTQDNLLIDSPAVEQNRISGTASNYPLVPLTFYNDGNASINSVLSPNPGVQVSLTATGLVASNLQNFSVNLLPSTTNQFTLYGSNLALPVAGGTFSVNLGSGTPGGVLAVPSPSAAIVSSTGMGSYGGAAGAGSIQLQGVKQVVDLPTRPLIVVPDFAESYANPNSVGLWNEQIGLPLQNLLLDPLGNTYQDLISTLVANGYAYGQSLIGAAWDWRLPLAPAPSDGSSTNPAYNGIVNISASSLTDGQTYMYGLDYFGEALAQAAQSWQLYYGTTPASVDVIAHGAGGLIARAYIQSTAYGARQNLPTVNNLITIGMPDQGESSVWNELQDNFSLNSGTRLLSLEVFAAYNQVALGGTILSPWGNITLPMITDDGTALGNPVPAKFVALYMPALRDMLATTGIFLPGPSVPGSTPIEPVGNTVKLTSVANPDQLDLGPAVATAVAAPTTTSVTVSTGEGQEFASQPANAQIQIAATSYVVSATATSITLDSGDGAKFIVGAPVNVGANTGVTITGISGDTLEVASWPAGAPLAGQFVWQIETGSLVDLSGDTLTLSGLNYAPLAGDLVGSSGQNSDPTLRNNLLLNLNEGLGFYYGYNVTPSSTPGADPTIAMAGSSAGHDPNSFLHAAGNAILGNFTLIYSDLLTTSAGVQVNVGPVAGDSLVPLGNPIGVAAQPGQVWYEDVQAPGSGDGIVTDDSSILPFLLDPSYGTAKLQLDDVTSLQTGGLVNHTELMDNVTVFNNILTGLGISSQTTVYTDAQSGTAVQAMNLVKNTFLSLIQQPSLGNAQALSGPAQLTTAIDVLGVITNFITQELSGPSGTSGQYSLGTSPGGLTLPIPGDIPVVSRLIKTDNLSLNFTNVVYSKSSGLSGTITLTADGGLLLPNITQFHIGITGVTGTFNLADSKLTSFELTVGSLNVQIAQWINVTAKNIVLTPYASGNTPIVQVGQLLASVPQYNLSGSVNNFIVTSTGQVSLGGFTLQFANAANTGGNSNSTATQQTVLPGLPLPLDLYSLGVTFINNNPANFTITLTATVDSSFFSSFPFTPIIKIGPQVAASTTQFISFTVGFDTSDGSIYLVNAGPIVLGISNFQVGPLTLGGSITLGGIQNGQFVSSFGGSLSVVSGLSDLNGSATVAVSGTIDPSLTDGSVDMTAKFTVGFNFDGGTIVVKNAVITAGLDIGWQADPSDVNDFSDYSFSISATLQPLTVGLLSVNLGNYLTLQAQNVTLNLLATGTQDMLSFGGTPPANPNTTGTFNPASIPSGSLAAIFGPNLGPVSGWGGVVGNFAIDANGNPVLLPGFFVQLQVGSFTNFGLPSWIPIQLNSVGIQFNKGAIVAGELVKPDNFSLVISGGVASNGQLFPLTGQFQGLVVNVGAIIAGDNADAVQNLNAFTIGINGFNLGGVQISGQLTLGKLSVNGVTAYYGQIAGSFYYSGIGGGINLVISQYGPLVATLSLSGITVPIIGLVFGIQNAGLLFGFPPLPAVNSPADLLGTAFVTPPVVNLATIQQDLTNAITNGVYTWDVSFRLTATATVTDLYVQGLVTGSVTMAADVGLQGANAGLKFLMSGTINALGIPIANGAMVLDLTNPLVPKLDLAMALPAKNNPIGFLFPAQGELTAEVRTDGVAQVALLGLSTFFQDLAQGAVSDASTIFQPAIQALADDLNANPTQPLVQDLLNFTGANPNQVFTAAFILDRLVGNPGDAISGGLQFPNGVSDPNDPFVLDAVQFINDFLPALINQVAPAQLNEFIGDLGPVIQQSIINSLNTVAADANVFNPSLVINGFIQPQILGMPLGTPTAAVNVTVNVHQISFSFSGSILDMLESTTAPLLALLPSQLQAIHDNTNFNVSLNLPSQLPVALITGQTASGTPLVQYLLNNLNPFSNWQVLISSSISVFGFNIGSVSGFAFGPQLDASGNFAPSGLFAQEVRNLDPNGTGSPDPTLANQVQSNPGLIPVNTESEYDNMMRFGGLVLTGQLQLPDILIDPQSTIAGINWTPPSVNFSNISTIQQQITAVKNWLTQIFAGLTATTDWAKVQIYIPSPAQLLNFGDYLTQNKVTLKSNITQTAQAILGAGFIEGYSNLTLFGTDLGYTEIHGNASGIEADATIPWLAGLQTTFQSGYQSVEPNQMAYDLLTSPYASVILAAAGIDDPAQTFDFLENANLDGLTAVEFPVMGFTGDVSGANLSNWLTGALHLPASVFGPTAAFTQDQVYFAAYSPGYGEGDPNASPIERAGGFELKAGLDIPGLVSGANFDFQIQPFSFPDGTNAATFTIPVFSAYAQVNSLEIPVLGSSATLLTVNNFLFDLENDTSGLSLNLSGNVDLLGTTMSAAGQFQVNSSGVYGTLDLNSGTAEILQAVGYRLDGTFVLQINTTSTTELGVAAHTAFVYAQGTVAVGSFNISGTFNLSASDGLLDIAVNGQAAFGALGTLDVTGTLTDAGQGSYGILAVTDPSLDSTPLYLTGVLQIEINTSSSAQTATGFSVNPTTGATAANQTISIPAGSVIVEIGGQMTPLNLGVTLDGAFTFVANSQGLGISIVAQTSLFEISLAIQGSAELSSTGNLTCNIQASGGSGVTFSSSGFHISGTAALVINTSSDTVYFALSNATVSFLGFQANGSVEIGDFGGVLEVRVPSNNPISLNFYGLATLNLSGYLASNGTFDLQAGFNYTFNVGYKTGVTISGTLDFNNNGLSASVSGSGELLGYQIASINVTLGAGSGYFYFYVQGYVLGIPVPLNGPLAIQIGQVPTPPPPPAVIESLSGPSSGTEFSTYSFQASPGLADGSGSVFNTTWRVNGVVKQTSTGVHSYAADHFSFTPSAPGTYQITYFATDAARQSATQSTNIVVGDLPPTIASLSVPASGIAWLPVTVSGSASSPNGSVTPSMQVFLDGRLFASGNGNALTFTPSQAGSYTIFYQVTDAYGGTASQTEVVNVAADPTALVVNSLADSLSLNNLTLPDAITYANHASGPETISFASALAGQTFVALSGAPAAFVITGNVTIAGSASAGFTLARGSGSQPLNFFQVNAGASLTLEDLTLQGGDAVASSGGAIYNQGNLTAADCTFVNNQAGSLGGVIENTGVASVTDSSFTGNTAPHGAAVYNSAGSLALIACTIVGNTGLADVESSGASATLSLTSDLIYAVTVDSGSVSGSKNVIQNASGISSSLYTQSPLTGTNAFQVFALAPLGQYGGPTETIRVNAGSPAIGAGTNNGTPAFDQRGMPRTLKPTAGAYEVVEQIVVNSVLDAAGSQPGSMTLRNAVQIADAQPNAVTIAFDPSLAGASVELSTAGDDSVGPSALDITNNIAINGSAAPGLTIAVSPSVPDMRQFLVSTSGDLTLENLILAGGTAYGSAGSNADGGAVYNLGQLNLSDDTFTNNEAVGGAGANGSAGGNGLGGAIYNLGHLNVDDDTFSTNQAVGGSGAAGGSGQGGAIYNAASGTILVANTTLSFNTATGGTGASAAGGSALGGAVANFGSANVYFSTLADNTLNPGGGSTAGSAGGAAFHNTGNSVNIFDSILALSTGGVDIDNTGSLTLRYSLVQTVTNVALQAVVGNVDYAHNIVGTPLLGPLQNNGGSTDTQALLGQSPGLYSGIPLNCLGVTSGIDQQDQTGAPRPTSLNPDMGACNSLSPLANAGPTTATNTYTVPEGQPITLNASATISGVGIANYLWDFNYNGTFQASYSSTTPESTFSNTYQLGAGTIALEVVDNHGATSMAFANLVFTPVPPKILLIAVDNDDYLGIARPIGTPVTVEPFVEAYNPDSILLSWTVLDNGATFASGSTTDPDFSFTPTSPGSYVIEVTATDYLGASASASTPAIAVYDPGPNPSIAGLPNGSPEGTALSLTAGATSPSSFTWSVTQNSSNTVFATGSGTSFTFTPSMQGIYTVELTATDAFGIEQSTTESVNASPVYPTVTIGGLGSGTFPVGQEFDLTAIAAVPDAALEQLGFSYDWSLYLGNTKVASSTAQALDFTPAAVGAYQLSLTVTDSDGNAAFASQLIHVNYLPLSVTIVGAPLYQAAGQPVTLTYTATDPNTSGSVVSAFWSIASNSASGGEGSGPSFTFTPNAAGDWVVTLTVLDNYGASGTSSQQITVTGTKLTASIVWAPASGLSGQPILLAADLTGPNGAVQGVGTYSWTVAAEDGSVVATGSTSSIAFTPAAPGNYTVYLLVTDSAGNSYGAIPQIISIASPTTSYAPMVSLLGVPDSAVGPNTAVSLYASVSNSAGTLSYLWSLTGVGSTQTGTAATFNFTSAAGGLYVVSLTVTDANGAVAVASALLTVVNTPPSADFTLALPDYSSPEVMNVGGAVATATVNDLNPIAQSGGFTYYWTMYWNNSLAFSAAPTITNTLGLGGLVPGNYRLLMYVVDDLGLQSATVEHDFTVSPVQFPAAIETSSNASPQLGVPFTYYCSFLEPWIGFTNTLGSPLTDYSADGLTFKWVVTQGNTVLYNTYLTNTTGVFTWTPNTLGSVSVSLTVSDTYGNVGATSSLYAITGSDVPTVTIAGLPASVSLGSAANLSASVAYPSPLAITPQVNYFWLVSLNGFYIDTSNTSSLSFTPTEGGSYTVILEAADQYGNNVAATATFTPTPVAPLACITNAPATSPAGTPITLGSNFSDVDPLDQFIGWSWQITQNGQPWASASGSTLYNYTFTPDDEGTYVVTLTVTDANHLQSQPASATITVSDPTPNVLVAPVIVDSTSNLAPDIGQGDQLNLVSTVEDPATAVAAAGYTYQWTVTYDNQTVASGTTADLQFSPQEAGSYTAICVATDKNETAGTGSFTFNVQAVLPFAYITSASSPQLAGTPFTMTGLALGNALVSDVLRSTFNWSVVGQNSGAMFSGTGPTFTFTPPTADTYAVTITATDSFGTTSSPQEYDYVVTAPTPAVQLTGVPTSVALPTQVSAGIPFSFGESIADPDESYLAAGFYYDWNLTVGGVTQYLVSNQPTFTYTPPAAGSFTVELELADYRHFLVADVSQTVNVEYAAPIPSISGPTLGSAETPITINPSVTNYVAADGPDGMINNWSVTKDGQRFATETDSTGAPFTFTPDDGGTYVVSLSTTNTEGLSGTVIQTIDVSGLAPQVDVTGLPRPYGLGTGSLTLGANVTDTSSVDAQFGYSYAWTVQDPNGNAVASSTNPSITFTPSLSGQYSVGLTVTDHLGDATTQTVSFPSVNLVPITVTAFANSKTYDGTASAATNPLITSGSLLPGDTAVLGESYALPNVGTGITLSPTVTINGPSGNDAGYYAITLIPAHDGEIDQATPQVTVSASDSFANGSPYSAVSAAVAGINGTAGSSLESVGLTYDYQQVNSQGNVIADLGGQAPENPGLYQVTARFAGSPDYQAASASTTFTLFPATAIQPNSFDDSVDAPDSGIVSLRDAVSEANDAAGSSTVYIVLGAGAYNLSSSLGELQITNTSETVIIAGQGSSGPNATIIAASGFSDLPGGGGGDPRLFEVLNGVAIKFENLDLQNGSASDSGSVGGNTALGGAILNNGGNVSLTNVGLTSNRVVGNAAGAAQGGAIYSLGGSLTVNQSVFQFDGATGGGGSAASPNGGNGQGGAIYSSGGTLTLNHDQFISNSVRGGGGYFTTNNAVGAGGNGQGGAVYATAGSVTLSSNVFTNPGALVAAARGGDGLNTAHGLGGAAQGGGIYAQGNTLTLVNNQFSGLQADGSQGGAGQGGALYLAGAALDLTGNSINGCDAYGAANYSANDNSGAGGTGQGGGMYLAGSNSATLTDNSITNCLAQGGSGVTGVTANNGGTGGTAQGGGVYVTGSGTFTLIQDTLAQNRAVGGAGGYGVFDSAGSGGAGQGGALFLAGSSTVQLTNDTIAYNAATGGNRGHGFGSSSATVGTGQGGGLYVGTAIVTLNNTLAADNQDFAPSGNLLGPDDVYGSLASGSSYNLVGTDNGTSGLANGQGGNLVGSSASPIDPLLGQLAANGGLVMTIELLPGSPALNAGSAALAVDQNGLPLTTDARGFNRTYDGTTDVGALQEQVTLATPALQTAVSTAPFSLGSVWFDDSAVSGEAAVSVNWGDGSGTSTFHAAPGPLDNATHSYATPGAYTVTLTVTDADNDTTQLSCTVLVGPTVVMEGGSLDAAGSGSNDNFVFSTGSAPGEVTATVDGVSFGTFNSPGSVTVYGNNESVTIDGGSGSNAFTLDPTDVILDGLTFSGPGISNWDVVGGSGDNTFTVDSGATGSITGGTGTNTIVGPSNASTWTINGQDQGILDGIIVTFSSIQNLVGGAGNNVFVMDPGASIGTLTGGSGTNTLDYTSFSAPVSVNLQTSSATGVGSFSGIQNFLGTSSSDTLVGPNTDSTWQLTSGNAGTLNGMISFSSFENLTGGSGNDTFQVEPGGKLSGKIDGGAGTNTLDYSIWGRAFSFTPGAGTAPETGCIANIEALVGSSAGTTILGPNTTNTWTLTGNEAGNLNGTFAFSNVNYLWGGTGIDTVVGPPSTDSWAMTNYDLGTLNGVLTFNKMENLVGGSGNNSFQFLPSGKLTGTITGGGGTNTLDYSLAKHNVSVTPSAGTATDTAGIANIQAFIGSPAVSTLFGPNSTNTWTLTATGTGNLNNTFTFSEFNYLYGGTGTDALVGPSGNNTWVLNGLGEGTLNGTLSFNKMENLTGGSGNDDFLLAPGGEITGQINGSGGVNTLDYSSFGLPASVVPSTGYATRILGGAVNIAALVGSKDGTTLSAANVTNLWSITGSSTGTLNGTYSFRGVQNLTGGAKNDTFQFGPNGKVAGIINGGAGTNTLDYSLYGGAVSVTPSAGTASLTGGIQNIQNLVGTASGTTLFGPNQTNTWTLTGGNTGNLNGTFTFTGVTTLWGGTGTDTLIGPNSINAWVVNTYAGGTLNGSLAFDKMENLTGGAANDSFAFKSGGKITGTINGGGGSNTLDYTGLGSRAIVNLTAGTATETGGVSNFLVVLGYTGGNNILTGGPGGSILVGFGSGNVLTGGAGGGNLLIGGTGTATLNSGTSGDLMIGGSTAYDTNTAALLAIFAEWQNTAQSYTQRISDIMGTTTGGLNGSYDLNSNAVTHATSADTLVGGTGTALDWFFAIQGRDTIKNVQPSETVS